MEAVRPKKPKSKQTQNTGPTVVNGLVLPDVPTHSVREIERSATPEPEEITENSLVSEEVREDVPEALPQIPIPQALPQMPPPQQRQIDTSKLIFPKVAEPLVDTSNSVSKDRSPIHERPKISATYPSVPELTSIADYKPPLPVARTKPPDYTTVMHEVKENAPPMYPSASSIIYEKTAHGLLSEQQLLVYYYNPIYEAGDDFVNKFIQNEEHPNGPLFYLLKRYRELSDDLVSVQISDKANTELLAKNVNEVWSQISQSMDFKGRCGENKEGTGQIVFPTFAFSQDKIREVKESLSANRAIKGKDLYTKSELRSVALQIQWQICIINNQFMAEHGLSVNSSPSQNVVPTAGRSLLLCSLSDLFHHLRAPSLPEIFVEAVTGWIKELCCFLNMSCRTSDAQFLLNHLLRLPSPINNWSAQLVQTFVQCPISPKLKIDYCLTMMSHLMNPIKARDSFLGKIAQSEREDTGGQWAILSNDEDQGDFSFVTVNELDLTAFLDQLPVSEFYTAAYIHSSTAFNDKFSQFLSALAFQLLLMKILNDGLSTYARPGYKMFCKQIGNSIRQSVRELCSHWRVTRDILTGADGEQIQREVDRVVILAVHYLINNPVDQSNGQFFSAGLWQFLIDMPYDCVSEECRSRCELIIRTTDKLTLNEIYEIPKTELPAKIKVCSLKERIEAIGPRKDLQEDGESLNIDGVFLVNALSTLVSFSHADPSSFLKELIDVCYCDDDSRKSLYKVGAEGIATLLTRRPMLLDSLISIMDRNIDHMENYAHDVVASATLTTCRINAPVMSIIGKWLINNAPNEAPNRLARRIISGLHWGYADDLNSLWIDQKVHEICADSVVKAHAKHCNSSNGMISKSISKIAKMASKMPDHEQQFTQFCWDILVKLKLHGKTGPVEKPQNDLAAFYVSLIESQIHSPQLFINQGVNLLSELVSSGSSMASVVILSKVLANHYEQIALLSSNKVFLDVFDRIIHVDQCSYAVQWLVGPSSTPTAIVKFICCSISYYATRVPDIGGYLRAWIDVLCVQRALLWNNDQASLQILGTIARIAFLRDSKGLLALKEIFHNVYTKILTSWKESNKGLFSIFSSDQAPPPLISPTFYTVAPWATYLLLLVESGAFPTFYAAIYENLAKKDKYSLEQAVKKAASKVSINIPLTSLAPYCWATFLTACKDNPIYPLAVQQLATEVYKLRTVNGQKFQFARKIVDCQTAATIMTDCKTALLDSNDTKGGISKAVAGWLFTKKEVTISQFDFSQFDLDYLLQFILSNEESIWLDYVNIGALTKDEDQDSRLFIATLHLGTRDRRVVITSPSSTRFVSSIALGFPTLPSHQGLPTAPKVDGNLLFNFNEIQTATANIIEGINNMASEYEAGYEKLETEDIHFLELLPKHYTPASKKLPLVVKCHPRCQAPLNTAGDVTIMEFNKVIDGQIAANREKRQQVFAEWHGSLIDRAAVHTAGLEHIARQISRLAASCTPQNRALAQNSGRTFLYQLTQISNAKKNTICLFQCASSAYINSLRTLAQEFVRNRPEEQIPVMRLVLEAFVFSDPLIENFTPECLSSADLCEAYSRLSEAIRDSQKSKYALDLLSRLGMDKAATQLPPHQFAPLLPLAFKNLASQPDPTTPLHRVCMQHVVSFVFHAFPVNFNAGLELALKGCDLGETPVHLLESFVYLIGAKEYTKGQADYSLPPLKCNECAILTARSLADSRSRLPSFYTVWSRYIPSIVKLAQLFIYTPAMAAFQPDSPISVLQKDLVEIFGRVSSLFSPLVAVYSPTVPPFSLSHDAEAKIVLEGFVDLLQNIPQTKAVPVGMQNLESLLWQFYYEKLSILQQGTVHYFKLIESLFLSKDLFKGTFHPSLRGLQAMDECLSSRSKDCASFITNMVVRIPWKTVLQTHIVDDVRPTYLYHLASVMTRIAAYPSCYSSVTASFEKEMKSLSTRQDWNTISSDNCELLSQTVAALIPAESLTESHSIMESFLCMWSKICCFSPNEPYSTVTILKQTIWLRTQCLLLLKGSLPEAAVAYNSLTASTHSVAKNHPNQRAFAVVARELTVVWTKITDKKFGEAVVNAWNSYLEANPDSPLVLICLNTIIGSLSGDQLTTALKVLDKTIRSYFKRAGASWEDVMSWIQFPTASMKSIQDYLLCIPSSNSSVQPLHLVLKAFLDYGTHEDQIFGNLHSYITTVKPKHIHDEAAFALIIQRHILWLSGKAKTLPSTFAATEDLFLSLRAWMQKASKDESSFLSNLMSSKKAYTSKFRAILAIMEAYLTQQSLGDGKRPRIDGNTPVINVRINAVKEAATAKPFNQYSTAFNQATAYFTQFDIHQIGSAPQLMLRVSSAIFNERFLTDK